MSISVVLLAWTEGRIAPESAPVARGAAYAAERGCVECHGDPDNPLADANDRYCSNVNRYSWHPEYDVECTDVIAYFESVRLRVAHDGFREDLGVHCIPLERHAGFLRAEVDGERSGRRVTAKRIARFE